MTAAIMARRGDRLQVRGRIGNGAGPFVSGREASYHACMSFPDPDRLDRAYQTALAALLAERTPEGHWVGELSTSALSTATAVSALALVQKATGSPRSFDSLIAGGIRWLAEHQNADGGWGDTIVSFSNIST